MGMAKGILDDDEDIEAEIQRQLDALTESDVAMDDEESDEWQLGSAKDVAKIERKEDEQSSAFSASLPESMVLYLTSVKGCHDESVVKELQECNDTLESVEVCGKRTEEMFVEKLKKELGDEYSEDEVLLSRKAIEDMEKREEEALQLLIQGNETIVEDLACHGSKQEMEGFEELQQMALKQQEVDAKRRAESERRREEMKANERRVQEERKRRDEERREEQRKLEENQKIALEKLNEELERERKELERERLKHEAEMAQFVAEQQRHQRELEQLKAIEAERVQEINRMAAVFIQRVYRGYCVRKWMKPLLSQKKLERLRRQEMERQRKQKEEEERRHKEEQLRLRKQEEERKRKEDAERRQKIEERRRKQEEEMKRRKEEERKRIEDEKRKEEERTREEERRRKEEAEKRKLEEEERRRREEEERKRREEERRKREEEERRQRMEEERRKRMEKERKQRQEEDERRRREEEKRRQLAALEKQRVEEERQRKEEEERRQLEEERKRVEEEMKKTPQYVAAMRIQAVWRGHVTRVVLWDWLPWLQRREEERLRRNDAAVKIQALVRGVLLRKHLDDALLAARFEDEVDDFDYDQEIDLSSFDFDETQLDEGWGPAPTPQLPPREPPLSAIATQSDSNLPSHSECNRRHPPAPNPRVAWGSNSRTSNNASRLSCELSHSTPDVSHGRVLKSRCGDVEVQTPLIACHPAVARAEKARDVCEGGGERNVSHEWGFKNTQTAKMMLKRARRLKQSVMSRKKLQDPQKRLELFRKLDLATHTHSGVYRRQKEVKRTSYFSQRGATSTSPDSHRQIRVDRTFKWVHEHFVSPPDSQFVRSHGSQASPKQRDATSSKSSSLSDLLHRGQSLPRLSTDSTTKIVTPHYLANDTTTTHRRHSETTTHPTIRLPAIKVNSAPVRKTRNRGDNL